MLDEFIHEPRIAYFSMEIALRNEIPIYAGGLGMLAGDTMRSAADLDLPMVAVSLASHAGYFRQEIDAQGRQMEHAAIATMCRLASIDRLMFHLAHRVAACVYTSLIFATT